MTKEEFVASYPIEQLPSWIIVSIAIGVALLITLIICIIIGNWEEVVGIFLFFCLVFVGFGALIYGLQHATLLSNQMEWRTTTFQEKYLPTLPESKLNLQKYIFTENGMLNALVDSDQPYNQITNINKVYYIEMSPENKGYVIAKYVEGFEEQGISDGYYDVTLFLPKSN